MQILESYSQIQHNFLPLQAKTCDLAKHRLSHALGILTSSGLTWSKDVDKALGFVRRSTLNITNSAIRRSL